MTASPANIAEEEQWLASKSWRAELSLGFDFDDKWGTRLKKLSSYGPLRVQRPFYPESRDYAHVYLLHPPGGLVSGDTLAINIDLKGGAKVLITTPGAGKVYKALSDQLEQVQETKITVSGDSVLEFLPQENIIFDGANSRTFTRVELEDKAVYLGWEIICLGRPAAGEKLACGVVEQHTQVSRNGVPVFIDRLLLSGGSEPMLRPWGLNNKPVFGTFLICLNGEEEAENLCKVQRAWLNQQGCNGLIGVTRNRAVVMVRYIGDCTEEAKILFTGVWQCARQTLFDGEKSSAVLPRIWAT